MKKEFIPYEQALALKELGFDEPCFYQYVRDFDNDGELIPIVSENNYPTIRDNNQVSSCSGGDCFAAPLYQQAFRWFREKYELHSTITSISQESWQWHITKPGESLGKLYDEDFYTYEEAELACLEKLIEMAHPNK
jgi:hypothetical protein